MIKLTSSQKSIWEIEQYYKGSTVNSICGSAIIEEKIDFDKLYEAIQIVYKKYDNFKIRIKNVNENIFQDISKKENIDIAFVNVPNFAEFEREAKKIVAKPFELEDSELFRFYIIKFENGKGGFLLNIHHIISDSWTLALICNEIIKIYSGLVKNDKIEEQAIYSYQEYAKSEDEYINSQRFQKDQEYWKQRFINIPEVATIPGSRENPDEMDSRGNRKKYNISEENVGKIKSYCKENKISVFNFFMAIYGIYISEITNLDEFVIGTPILNRTNFKEKNAAGMFINTAPFKIEINQNLEFKELARNVARDSMDMLRHQKYSYQYLIEDLRKINKKVPNLYNILLSYQIANAMELGDEIKYTTQWTYNGSCAENIDIQIYDLDDTGSLNISYDYKTSIYDEKDIENIHFRILNIINQIINKNDIKLNEIELVTREEKEILINKYNNTNLEYDENKPIIKYFEEQVEKFPNDIALVFENKEMTYKELNEKANSLAFQLRSNGIKNNSIVGIVQERSFEMMIAILAVLKSGGAYIPIDPNYPKDRIEYMIKDSDVKLLLSEDNNFEIETLNIKLGQNFYNENKENISNISNKEDLSYLIYTSGSTGTPKGVMLKQGNLSNFYNSMLRNVEYLQNNEKLRIISITTISFDIFIFESLMSLTRGLTLYMTNENEQKITEILEKKIKDNQIEAIQTTPSVMKFHLENLKNKNDFTSLKYMILAGELLTKQLVDEIKNIIPNIKIYNGYGPSETTIFATINDVTNCDKITIGNPVANSQIYIVNKNGKLLPKSSIGEMYISGDCVGKGYMNKEKETLVKFIENPYDKSQKMYKSGDLGYYAENGEIICCGRIDNQVKIRGLRVELSEIEKQILSISEIKNAIVVKKEINNRPSLCAYYTENSSVNEEKIKENIKNKLPQYMMPQYFVRLDNMPHTPNGKIDKNALPIPEIGKSSKEKIEARNKIDNELIEMIKKMLNINYINLSDTLLDLGGDSLTAISLITKISAKYNIQIYIKDVMSNKSIKDISDIIQERINSGTQKIKIEKAQKREIYPLSSAQKRIYYNSIMIGTENLVYNMPGGIIVDGLLDYDKVIKSFNKIVERHSVLKTSFIIKDDQVMQKIDENKSFRIKKYDNTSNQIPQIIKDFSKPFDLSKDELIRVELHYIDHKKTLLLVESHHIIMDGTSLNNLIIEFERLYNGANLKKIPIQYIDYSVWENDFLESEKIEDIEKYWLQKFENTDFQQLNLPYDFKMPNVRSYKGSKVSNFVDESKFRKIIRCSKKVGVSPYVMFISAFFVLLYKYTGQEEILLGSPIANRDINETKRMLGMFVNNIVLKANIDSKNTFLGFLNTIKEQVINDLSNQPYPFDRMVKKLDIKTDNSRNPMFDIMFTYQNQEEDLLKLDDCEVGFAAINNDISKFNLSVEIKPKSHIVNIEYCTDLFKKETIERLYEHYMNVIDVILKNIEIPIKDIEIISEKEKSLILDKFNDTKMDYPKDKTIIELFEEQVEKTPDNIAIVFEDEKITYKELNEKANQLANYISNYIVDKEERIAVILDKSLEMIVAILAILKNECAYLPIDMEYPLERKEYIIKDASSHLLLTSRKINIPEELLIEKVFIDLDTAAIYKDNNETKYCCDRDFSDLAYVMYTSGSTGRPKGVMVENRNVVRLVKNPNYINFKNTDKMLQTGSIVFDACTFEIWGALLNGLELYIIKKEDLLDVNKLKQYIDKNEITILWITAPLFSQLSEENPKIFENARCLLTGGDVLSCKHINKVRKVNPTLKVINGYGPTENTTFSCCFEIEKEYSNSIPIGRPISNSTAYVVSKDNNLQPIGIPGELLVGGDGVSRGYLNREDLTNERFISNKFGNGRIYKTGDLAKWKNDGTMDFLGRIDGQIKIRGFRVELSEITEIVLKYPEINEAFTIFKPVRGEKTICTYFASSKCQNIEKIEEFMNSILPKYMIPKVLRQVDNIPKNKNGKVDRTYFLNLEEKNIKSKLIIKPENELEEKILEIFKEVLKINEISVEDDFFEIGGDSISAMRLQVEAMRKNINITYGDIFKYPTIRKLANKQKELNNSCKYIEKYDEYNELIKNNTLTNISNEIKESKIGNVLLTGVTGFLGVHILDSYLTKKKGKIYCLVRGKNNMSSEERLKNTLEFYFGQKYITEIGKRIVCVDGDISLENLGLTLEKYDQLAQRVTTVIHSAALVKHFGNYSEFEKINVNGTKRIVEFCKKYKKRLMHISTISVSGNNFAEGSYIENDIKEDIYYGENKFYIGQNLENLYVRSKFLAEKEVLDAKKNGLEAFILRMGNLTSRYTEGKFQQNHLENAFVNRIKTFLQLGCIPDYLMDGYVEFTPIDYSADAIIDLAGHYDKKYTIFHLLNNKHLTLLKFEQILIELGIPMRVISEEEFNGMIEKLLQDKEKTKIIQGITRDFNKDRKLIYSSNIKIKSDFTREYLRKIDFDWPEIDKEYIEKYFKYLIDIGYLNIIMKEK